MGKDLLYLSHSVLLYSTLSDTVAVTQSDTDWDRPGQTRTNLIKRTFGTLFRTLKVLLDHSVPFCPTLSYSVQLYSSHSVSLYSTLSDTVAVTQTGTDLDRPG